MKTTLILFKAIAAGGVLSALAGCVATSPNLDRQFGTSIRILNAQQTMDPNASANPRTGGLDGQAAQDVVERYQKSYKAPTPQPNVFTIGVGSGS